ncbi:hypothetical protein D3C73_1010870 [compost metagenome]
MLRQQRAGMLRALREAHQVHLLAVDALARGQLLQPRLHHLVRALIRAGPAEAVERLAHLRTVDAQQHHTSVRQWLLAAVQVAIDAVAVQPHQYRRTGRHRNTLGRLQYRDGAHLAGRHLRVACLRVGQHLLEE